MGAWGETALRAGWPDEHAHGGVEAGIADAPLADAAIGSTDMLEQPLDGVVGVGALVHGGAADGPLGPHVHELALGHHPSAHILVDEDETLILEGSGRAQLRHEGLLTVGVHTVGRALQEDGVGAVGVPRRVDGREEVHAIPHGDERLALGVVVLDPGGLGPGIRLGPLGLEIQGARQEGRDEEGRDPQATRKGHADSECGRHLKRYLHGLR